MVVNFSLPGKYETAADEAKLEQVADAPVAAVAAVQRAHPELRVEEYGDASAQKALGAQQRADEAKSMQFSLGGTLLILLLAFGAAVAAGVPLLLGVSAFVATTGLLGPVSQLSPLHEAVGQVTMLIGLAVGVDYAMFYLRRMMEEKDKGRSSEAALDVAAATSGRAVLISGFTVMAAMAGMFFSGNPIFSSFGIGTIIVVGVAMVGSLTFLPAVLSYLGQKGWIEKGRVPYVAKRRHKTKGESRMWNAILGRVLKRPLVSAILAGGLLVALTIPALGMQFKEPGTEGMSRSQPIVQTLDRVDAAFPGGSVPANVVVKANDVTKPEVQTAIQQLHDAGDRHRSALRALRRRHQPRQDRRDRVTRGQGQGHRRRLGPLRAGPARRGRPGHRRQAPGRRGRRHRHDGRLEGLPRHDEVAPADRVRLRARAGVHPAAGHVPLDRGADQGDHPQPAVGRLRLRHPYAGLPARPRREALGFNSVGGITPWLPLFLFVVLFGLSMDYHVFVLSRIRELVDRGMSTEKAVAEGIKSTAGVITSAAAVMVVTFAGFAIGSDQSMKQLGVGLAAAILIDATIVRAVLLPATMKLLGKHNWYLPKGLRWLPKFEHEPEVTPAPA